MSEKKQTNLFTPEDLKILETQYQDFSDAKILELDISNVRGSVRLRTGRIITPKDVMNTKSEILSFNFPH